MVRPMKVLQINSMLSGGGTDEQCLKLCSGLQELGCRVMMVGPIKAELGQEVLRRRIPLHVLPPGKVGFIRGLARVIRRERPEIVHVHHGRDYWPVVLARRLAGTGAKLVISRHLAKSPSSWLSKKFLLNQCDALVAVSEFVAQVLKQGMYEPSSPVVERRARPPIEGDLGRIRVIHGGIDMERFRPGEASALRREWGLADGQFAFAVVGAYDFPVGKGQREFLQAAALIQAQHPQARFLIIGRGTMRDALLDDIQQLGLTGQAWLTPYCQDMPAAMNAIDCLVHPAQGTEAFGLVLIEAFACGKPVIATRLDGIPEAFAFQKSGRLIDSLQPEAIAQAMREVLASSQSAPTENDLTALRQQFSLQSMAKKYFALYQELMKPKT
jgi:glycosyltransferase involved in cell wall biosynthesis